MNRRLNLKTTTLKMRSWINLAIAGRGFLLIPLALTWFALSPTARAVCREGCDSNDSGPGNAFLGADALKTNTSGTSNTAIGDETLEDNTSGSFNTAIGNGALSSSVTGSNNTGTGAFALVSNSAGSNNTATGSAALENNGDGNNNTATGYGALFNNHRDNNTATGFDALVSNTFGNNNTANGFEALDKNVDGTFNTANGADALFSNTTGNNNTANGFEALDKNVGGSLNTANGAFALDNNTSGSNNTANGVNALFSNSTGANNTADGESALFNSTGSNNIALGASAGSFLTTGNNNIDIGALGVAGESNVIRLGKTGVQHNTLIAGISGVTVARGVGVIVDANGHLGTIVSSARFKDAIQPMDKASEAIFALHPVTFRYKKDLDPEGIPQFGLVAEQVEKVDPNLVVRDAEDKVYTVRYEAVNAMLLNEFLKEHRTVQELKATVAQQQKQIKDLITAMQEVSNRLEGSNAGLQLIANNP